MERLTHKARYEAGYKLNKGIHPWIATDKLGAYENTGLTPEEIMDGKLLTGWIPVSEQLPEDEVKVLVTAKDMDVETAYCDREGWHLAFNGRIYARNPLVWMPLPEAYRAD